MFFNSIPLRHRKSRFQDYSIDQKFELPIPLLMEKALSKDQLRSIQSSAFALLQKYIEVTLGEKVVEPIGENLDSNYEIIRQAGKQVIGNTIQVTDVLKTEYDDFHGQVSRAFDASGLGKYIDVIQHPINVRLKIGDFDHEQEHTFHDLSSSRAHIDMWSGAVPCLNLCILEFLNYNKGAKIEFSEITRFPRSLAKTLDKGYKNNKAQSFLKSSVVSTARSRTGFWYIADAYTPHQTVYLGEGIRFSVDFRFTWKSKIQSDYPDIPLQDPSFIKYRNWVKKA